MRLAAGATLGPYRITALLGSGGTGEVYRARDPRLDRDVAIKVLPADLFTNEDRRRRFVREARATSSLSHPNVVTVHEIATAGSARLHLPVAAPDRSLPTVKFVFQGYSF